MKNNNLNETITQFLIGALSKKKGEKLTSQVCSEIYQDIFSSLTKIFEQTSAPLSNESANYIAQMYYDSVTINGDQELDPNIFTERACLSKISTKEIALMAMMFNHTPFATSFISEIKKRS
jgi:hypothetical protein